jgi:hypothetical protein
MRPITISLDSETWEKAKEKTNFSQWVRGKLRSERNQEPINVQLKQARKAIDLLQKQSDMWWRMLMEERGGTVVEMGEEE